MKALVFHGPEDIRLEDIPVPEITEDEALLRVHASAICATDIRVSAYGHRKIPEGSPSILGHEMAGEISKVGSSVKNLRIGQRVSIAPVTGCGTCRQCITGNFTICRDDRILGLGINGGFAEFMVIPADYIKRGNVFILPDEVSYETGAIAEPLATAFTGMEACNVKPAAILLIVGAGPIGLMYLMLSKVFGVQQAMISEIMEDRIKIARQFGADHVINPEKENINEKILKLSYGRGPDAIIIAAPSKEAQEQSIELAAIGGHINFFGTLPKGSEFIRINSNLIHYKNIKVLGTTGTTVKNYHRTMELLISKRVDISKLVTARFPLEKYMEAFKLAKSSTSLKVLFNI
jgi:L-iditol 2-dehydrogenase